MYPSISSLPVEYGFLDLGSDFSSLVNPTPLPNPSWVITSKDLAKDLGLNPEFTQDIESLNILSGNFVPNNLKSYSSVYSGHQFGVWAGQLGDGRAISFGHLNHDDQKWEIQLKGAGPTPYSRMGDGRAVLRSSIREFLCSEAMFNLGIPTTRALAITSSPKQVVRETVETAAVVTRVAPSFIRFGHFEHFAAYGLHEQLQKLTNYVISQFYPDLQDKEEPYLALFEEVLNRSARLVASWQSVGFCHGVLNTDNMSIIGLTLDYGPFGFLDRFDLNHICNHTDSQGRYSYANQPTIFYWNLVRLAQAMLPIIAENDSDEAMEIAISKVKPILATFSDTYLNQYRRLMSQKLGFNGTLSSEILDLLQELIKILDNNRVDYTFFFRNLSKAIVYPEDPTLRNLMLDVQNYDAWFEKYHSYLKTTNTSLSDIATQMNAVNPKFILRQHLAQIAISESQKGDHSYLNKLYQCLSNPFEEQPEFEEFAQLPPDWAEHLEVSCSS